MLVGTWRTEYAPNDTPPALEGHPRADGARRDAGGAQTGRWPEIGSGMGAKEARRTLPQASEDLLVCRLGTRRHHLIVSLEGVVDTSSFSLRPAIILRYSPECVEGGFSEVHIQDAAYPRPDTPRITH